MTPPAALSLTTSSWCLLWGHLVPSCFLLWALSRGHTVFISCPLGATCLGGQLIAISLPAVCATPLGMETGAIANWQISASSMLLGFMGLQRWAPELARLHRSGIVNAWTASNYDKKPWIQVRKGQPRSGWRGGRGGGAMSVPAFGGPPWEGS